VPKLKVFCTPIGFHDALVAAPSQKAALKAWGTTTDLFAAGRASIVDDPELQELALARPGEVVKRPRGDAHALIEQMEAEDARDKAAERKAGGKARKPTAPIEIPAKKAPKPPDRRELDRVEGELAAAAGELRDGLQALAKRRAALDDEERALRAGSERRLADLKTRRDRLAASYKRAVQPRRR
jgi:hypothetical protein